MSKLVLKTRDHHAIFLALEAKRSFFTTAHLHSLFLSMLVYPSNCFDLHFAWYFDI